MALATDNETLTKEMKMAVKMGRNFILSLATKPEDGYLAISKKVIPKSEDVTARKKTQKKVYRGTIFKDGTTVVFETDKKVSPALSLKLKLLIKAQTAFKMKDIELRQKPVLGVVAQEPDEEEEGEEEVQAAAGGAAAQEEEEEAQASTGRGGAAQSEEEEEAQASTGQGGAAQSEEEEEAVQASTGRGRVSQEEEEAQPASGDVNPFSGEPVSQAEEEEEAIQASAGKGGAQMEEEEEAMQASTGQGGASQEEEEEEAQMASGDVNPFSGESARDASPGGGMTPERKAELLSDVDDIERELQELLSQMGASA